MFFLANVFLECSLRVWEYSPHGRCVLYMIAEYDYNQAHVLLHQWQCARPKLWISQDEYASSLVIAMIDACERGARYTYYQNVEQECLENAQSLRKLLDQMPPGMSPLNTRASLKNGALTFRIDRKSRHDSIMGRIHKERGGDMSVRSDFRRQIEKGYGLTTAEILYRRPDHQWLLQQYVWQNYDLFPKFPELRKFLDFWMEKLEGPLHSVKVAHTRLIKPAELKLVGSEFRLH
jgi:uncharacterized protein Usg